MPNFQLGDNEKASYALTALDGDSNPAVLAPGDVVSVTSSDPTSLTVAADSPALAGSLASGFIVGTSQLQNGVQVTAAIKKADGSLELSTMTLVDVVGGTATSLSFSFGAPVLQGGTGGGTPPGAPAIASLTPASGAVGSAVVIAGTGFGAAQGASTISFGNSAAVVARKRASRAKPSHADAASGGTDAGQASSYSDTSITINVPAGAVTGDVIVTTAAGASNGFLFTLAGGVNPPGAPVLSSLSPASGAIGSTVVLAGSGFGAAQGASTIMFGSVNAGQASAFSDSSITILVPAGALTGNVSVTTASGTTSGVLFTVSGGVITSPPGSPNIASFAPSAGPVGSVVVLSGSGFGALQGSTTLSVGGASASASAWSDTSVTFAIPPLPVGLADILVIVGGVNSNAQSFNVTGSARR